MRLGTVSQRQGLIYINPDLAIADDLDQAVGTFLQQCRRGDMGREGRAGDI